MGSKYGKSYRGACHTGERLQKHHVVWAPCDWGPLFQVPRTHPPFLGEESLALQPPASSALPGPGPRLQLPSVPESCPLSPCSPCLRAPATEFPPACRMSAPQPPPSWRLLHLVLRLGNRWAEAASPAWFQNKYCFII